MENISFRIGQMVSYGLAHLLIDGEDVVYTCNQILAFLKIDGYDVCDLKDGIAWHHDMEDYGLDFMEAIIDWAYEHKLIEENTATMRDLFDSKLMNLLMPKPSQVIRAFNKKFDVDKVSATNWYYNLSKRSNYIRVKRVNKNVKWQYDSQYGLMDITINLSKPEKDPKEIAAARNMVQKAYPKCVLCKENEGFLGNLARQGRSNHRVLPIKLNNEAWFFQYSPYEYYNEHSIIFSGEHAPMKIGQGTVEKLLEFVEKVPHYFAGSNADLPIVGGSILSHDHFQGGRYKFAIEDADVVKKYEVNANVAMEVIKWPLSVIRVRSADKEALVRVAKVIMDQWKNYSDMSQEIISHSGAIEHNTITPICRRKDALYELDIVLRNNRTSETHPDGIFHPHEEIHNIKKENIGLIEVMGLAVLPSRLENELQQIEALVANSQLEIGENLLRHQEWIAELRNKYSGLNRMAIHNSIKDEVGSKFEKALEHAGVFKMSNQGIEAFDKFIHSTGVI